MKFIREYLRSGNISSRGKKHRQNYGNHSLSFPSARRMSIDENAGIYRDRKRNQCAGRQ